jgi:hypothetical protein
MLSDRLIVIQRYLDRIETGWRIGKPSGSEADPDVVVLENAGKGKVAYAALPPTWFGGGMPQFIEWEIRRALNDTKAK